jgi:hypothetical protein
VARQRRCRNDHLVKNDRELKKVLDSVTLDRYVFSTLPKRARKRKAGRTPAFDVFRNGRVKPGFLFWRLLFIVITGLDPVMTREGMPG